LDFHRFLQPHDLFFSAPQFHRVSLPVLEIRMGSNRYDNVGADIAVILRCVPKARLEGCTCRSHTLRGSALRAERLRATWRTPKKCSPDAVQRAVKRSGAPQIRGLRKLGA
jgi:hypothetical protein